MARRYIDGPEVMLTVNDGIFLDAQFYSGEQYELLEPKRLFPVSGLTQYISLMDSEGNEVAVIRNLDTLIPESRQAVEQVLHEQYIIPKLKRFVRSSEKFRIWKWTWETDKGEVTFEIINHVASIKTFYDGRVLIKDGNDNRYEIPNLNDLDKRSLKMLLPNL